MVMKEGEGLVTAADDDVSDEVLIERIKGGDEAAFQALFSRYVRVLERFAERRLPGRLRRRVSVADVLQEAQLVALERILDFEARDDASFRNWLMRIVEFKVKQAVRCHQGAARRAMDREVTRGARTATGHLLGHQPSPSQVAIGAEVEELARKAMDALPDHYREVLRLAREERLPLAEVGERMGRSAEAARKLLGRALSAFTEEFERLQGESPG
jgi:RNA polymerase sigma-70 factor (ECF subfamily)